MSSCHACTTSVNKTNTESVALFIQLNATTPMRNMNIYKLLNGLFWPLVIKNVKHLHVIMSL